MRPGTPDQSCSGTSRSTRAVTRMPAETWTPSGSPGARDVPKRRDRATLLARGLDPADHGQVTRFALEMGPSTLVR